jgi:CheY-like chemotaxis protein
MEKILTVLFIDDIKEDRQLFREVLKSIDRTIKYIPSPDAQSAIDYLTAAHTVPPDYIFINAHMAGMSGIECLQRIKKIKYMQHVPIIIYTHRITPSLRETANLLGAKMCLAKSNDISEACYAVASIIGLEYNKPSKDSGRMPFLKTLPSK